MLRAKPSTFLLLAALLGLVAPLRAVDYFVALTGSDNNDGKSAAKPFRNIAKAASVVNSGDTVTVSAGTYTETLSLIRPGAPGAAIVFRSPTRGSAKIVGLVRVLANYIDFTGFDVSNPSLHGISVSAHHVRILNNDVHDCSGDGITAFSFDYLTVEGNRSQRNGLVNFLQASGIHLFQAVAFDQAAGFHNVVRGNLSSDNDSKVNTQGGGTNFTLGIGILIEDFRNTLQGSSAGVYRPATLVENNVLTGNVGRAIVLTKSDNITVRNNTAWNNLPLRNPNTSLGDFSCQDTDGATWVNNILVTRGTPQVALFDSRTTNTVWDYNLFWGGALTITDGSTTVLGNHNFVADARLVDPAAGNVRPGPESLAIDNGNPAQAPATDFEGNPRPVGRAPDLGAYEFKPDPAAPSNVAPTLSVQPAGQTALSGGIMTLSAVVAGSSPLSYQWSKNDAAIAGATAAGLTLSPLRPADAGSYTLKVTNSSGSVTSSAAVVAVASTPSFAWRNPTVEGGTLYAVAFAGGKFVAVGIGGRVLTSIDAVTWTMSAILPTTALRGLAYDGTNWIAVGDSGTIFASRDAVSWAQRTSPTTSTLYWAAYVNNQFVVSGATGVILVSSDGSTWNLRTTGITQNLYSITGNAGTFVAAGQTGTLLSSTDTLVWTKATLTNVTADFNVVTAVAGQFVAVGNSGIVHSSADGVTWTSRTTSTVTNNLRGLTQLGSQFVLATDTDRIFVTPNFATYTSITLPFNPTAPRWGLTAAAGLAVAVGAGGEIATSTDGLNWIQRGSNGSRYQQNNLMFANGLWFVVGSNTGIFTSADGVAWSRLPIPASNWLYAVGYGAGRYVATGDGGYITTSVDGINWTGNTTAAGTTQSLRGLAYGNGRFVVVGTNGALTTSTNGTAWATSPSGVTTNLNAVTVFGNTFIAVGDNGVILTSTTGTTWSPASSGTTQALRGICVQGGTAYIVGGGRTILASTDGQTWSPRTVTPLNNSNYRGITPCNGGLLVVGDQGVALYSADGIVWNYLPALGYAESMQAVASNSISTVMVGTGGTILQSGNPSAVSSRLVNVATRGLVQPGGTLTPGFVLRGTGAKQVVVRAVGPTLAAFGLNGLADLKLDVVNQQTSAVAASNDDWGGSSALSNSFAALGAFALSANSKDAAVQSTLSVNQGGYSVRIAPSGAGTTGVALAEVYDADPDSSPVRLINVSTLGFVGTGDNVLTPGFVIRGSVPKLVLIRAVGPGLAQLGVGGLLPDPQISVFSAGSSIALASNNDWGGTPALKAAFTAAGAFSIPDTSKDAAVLLALPPGGYTIVTSGVAGATGTALVEVYDLDP